MPFSSLSPFAQHRDTFGSEDREKTEASGTSNPKIAEYLEGRNLINVKRRFNLHQDRHDKRLQKELSKTSADNRLLKYRINHINTESKCDTGFINNLHTFYGDGSYLGRDNKDVHYAIDDAGKVHDKDGEDSVAVLKSLGASRSNVTRKWLDNAISLASKASLRHRSFSCININIDFTNDEVPEKRTRADFHKVLLSNIDDSVELPSHRTHNSEHFFNMMVAYGFASSVIFANSDKFPRGKIAISRVLFSTSLGHAYCIPAKHETEQVLRRFCSDFITWMNSPGGRRLDNSRNSWEHKNVVLFLEDKKEDGTHYRRARHLGQFDGFDWFLELDTAMLRKIILTTISTVIKLPFHFTEAPIAFFEARFKGCDNPKNFASQVKIRDLIEEIRECGFAYISNFDYKSSFKRPFSDAFATKNAVQTYELGRVRKYEKGPITTLFCEEADCCMMCDTSEYIKKEFKPDPEPSPRRKAPTPSPANKDGTFHFPVVTICRTLPKPEKKYEDFGPSKLEPIPDDDKFFARC